MYTDTSKDIQSITTAQGYHVPVLLDESVSGLNIKPGGIYVDVTFGGGGHSREILRRLPEGAHLYSFDQDADAERNIGDPNEKFTFVRSNFRYLKTGCATMASTTSTDCLPTSECRRTTSTMPNADSHSDLTLRSTCA